MSKNPQSSGGSEHRRDVSGSIHVRGEIETHIPADVIKKHDAEEKKKEARDKFRLSVEIAGLISVIVYAVLTGFLVYFANGQLKESRKVTQDADAHFRMGQRAWVGVGEFEF